MLLFKNRLKKKTDITNVFKKGTNIAGNFIFLRLAKNGLQDNRFAFVVGLKISKSAVKRNTIKRQLRDILRKNIFKARNGFDFLIITKPEIINKKYTEIEKELINLFKKSKIISE